MVVGTTCKFRCTRITDEEGGSEVAFTPVTCGSPENEEFFKYTPYGELKIWMIDTARVHALFSPGAEYYIDIMAAKPEGSA